ncbi:MAG: alpha-ketoacid dehydrogenase subunit beta [Proteobacteria bacterium]|nr:alpha-ketoacid dehydrogenase subunit beta [Pseudomonadota bacterium]
MREITFAQALNEAISQEMEKDPRVFLIGEDVASGVFAVTKGLVEKFGRERVINAPMCESGFSGAGVGAAMMGMKPIVEIMLMDFITLAMDMIANQASKQYYITGGQIHVPIVFRTATGLGRRVGAHHSQNLAAWFMHIPGIKVAIPSTPYDAKGLLCMAIEDGNPVLFIENRNLYAVKGPVPEELYTIPFGETDIKREGKDATVVATGRSVGIALKAADALARDGIDCEVIDLRTLVPLDEETIIESVKKTGRLVTVDDGYERAGVGSEIVTTVMRKIPALQAPALTIASPNAPVPSSPYLEDLYMVTEKTVADRVKKMMGRA